MMQLQLMTDGHYAEIKEVLTKSPLQDWLRQEEQKLLSAARPKLQDKAFWATDCPVLCRANCASCSLFDWQANWIVKGWKSRS